MSRRMLLAFRDWLQDPGASVAGGVWNQPIANVLDPRPQFVAEAADNRDWGSTTFDFDLGRTCLVGLISLINFRATAMGRISVKAGADPTFVDNNYSVYTTCWPQDSVAGENNAWGQWTLNGVYLGDTYAQLGMQRFFIPDTPFLCRYGRIAVKDSAAAVPLQIGCVGAWDVWEPTLNLKYDWAPTFADPSEILQVEGGSTYVTERKVRRRLNFGFDYLPDDDAWLRGFDLSLIKGRKAPLVVLPYADPTESTKIEKAGLYGRVSQDTQLSNPLVGRFALNFQVDEDY